MVIQDSKNSKNGVQSPNILPVSIYPQYNGESNRFYSHIYNNSIIMNHFNIKIYCYHSSPRKKLISKVFARLHPPGNLEFVAKRRLKREKTGATCSVSTLYFLIWKSWRGGGARGYNRQYLNILVKECLVRADIKMNGGGPTSIHH